MKLAIGGLVVAAAIAIGVVIWWFDYDDPAIPWPAPLPACDGFEQPVPGARNTQPFGANDHLGDDWTAPRGTPVHAASSGVVIQAVDFGGDWKQLVKIAGCGVELLYAHLDTIEVPVGARVTRGQRIGTVGVAGDGPHLHFEIRDRPLPIGGGYGSDRTGYINPAEYIRAHPPR